MIQRIVIVGFSGTGKSSVASRVATSLGWRLLDMDDELERREGMTVPAMFATHGEEWFRERESALLIDALSMTEAVVSTGGGAVCTDAAWDAIARSEGTLTIAFDASPEEIFRRLRAHAEQTTDRTTERPMLAGDDPPGRIRRLIADRTPFYERADIRMNVERHSIETIAEDLVELVRLETGEGSRVDLVAASGSSAIHTGHGTRDQLLPVIAERWPKAKRLWIGVDEHVAAHHRSWIHSVQGQTELAVHVRAIAAGEGSKSISGVSDLYDWMLSAGVERGDVAVALGGGVVGDLMGFAAATTLRGIGLVQIPTTLLSMVDSSVGGKTGINHPAGKNLIGAFYQPPIVLVDPQFLATLPEREYRSGFAEIIKHGVIEGSVPGHQPDELFATLERNADRLLRRDEPLLSWVIRQNIALKAAVVAADERETTLRQILNFGHTIGHGIEAAGYSLLHGEAVAVGMIAALHVAEGIGVTCANQASRTRALIDAFGLPTRAKADADVVWQKMATDKKKAGGKQQWVLPDGQGGVQIRTDVPESVIRSAITSVTTG